MVIGDATEDDWSAIWPFFEAIVGAAETFSYDSDMTVARARKVWMLDPPGRTIVARADDGTVVASAKMHPNHGGGGSHVATASFMVDPAHGGRGLGRALGEEMIAWAGREGYRAIQFNAVVETNHSAVALWRSLGFEVLATVPEGFRHPEHGFVGLHVMHRRVERP